MVHQTKKPNDELIQNILDLIVRQKISTTDPSKITHAHILTSYVSGHVAVVLRQPGAHLEGRGLVHGLMLICAGELTVTRQGEPIHHILIFVSFFF